ncbi:conserved hypothetical protein, partial [Leishmania mexicana MHOM/GT/2001/U1103]
MEANRVTLQDTESFLSLDEFKSNDTASYTAENSSDRTKQDDLSATAAKRHSAASSLILEQQENTPISYFLHLHSTESFASVAVVDIPAALQGEEEAPALRRVGTPVEPQMRLAVTTHRVRLDGDLWGRVVDEWPDLLEQEFTSDVCDATALPPTSMQRLVLTAGSLIADFQLSHGGLAKKELNKQLANSPFTRTWGLYERVAEAKDTPPTRATPPAGLRDAESFASLEAVDIPAALQGEEHAPALRRVGTPVEPQMRLAVTTHRVRLDGDLWGRVVDEWPDLLEQEFTSDVCDATALPPTSMQRLVLTAGSLIADFQLSHGGLAKKELNKQLANSPFTRTWGLYERVAEAKDTPPTRATPPAGLRDAESFASLEAVDIPAALQGEEHAPALRRVGTPVEPQMRLAVTTHRVRLDSDLWGRVVDEWPDLLEQEFTSDVCDATALPPTSMQRLVLTAGSLIADFQLSHGGLAKKELNKQLANSPFTRTWGLYERVAEAKDTPPTRATPPAGLRDAESFASLEAVDIPAALRAEEEAPKVLPLTAFEEEAPALRRVGTPEESRRGPLETTTVVGARPVTPPAALRDSESFASLEAVGIPAALRAEEEAPKVLPLTAFEEEAPALRRVGTPEESRRGPLETTTVVGARPVTPPAALRDSESFASLEAVDIPAALRAEEEAPKVLPLTAFEEEAPALRRVGTPEEPQMGLAVTAHRVRLDGDLWGRVVDEWPDLLEQEFTSDVCDATGLPPDLDAAAGAHSRQPHRRLPALAQRHRKGRAGRAAGQLAFHADLGAVRARRRGEGPPPTRASRPLAFATRRASHRWRRWTFLQRCGQRRRH